MSRTDVSAHVLSDNDLLVDRSLADIASSFRFLLDVTPTGLLEARETFRATGRSPSFEYRPLADDPDTTMARLDAVPISEVEEPTVASLLQAKQRELVLLVQMLACRGSDEFLTLSIEQFGAVSPALLHEAESILRAVPFTGPEPGPWLDADEFASLARAELDRYCEIVPTIDSHVEVRAGGTGVMVSNGDLLVAPTARVSAHRADALIQHEVGTHVLTFLNGSHQPLRTLASGLAGHEETQEGLAVLAEYLVGGLTANRLRQLAARVVSVHQMLGGAEFPDVHQSLVDAGVPTDQAFTITTRVFRSGGLTKDAVYLRGLHGLLDHLRAGQSLDPLWLGKMPLTAVPLIEDLHRRGVLGDPLLTPRYLEEPLARERLALVPQLDSLASLIGDTS
ncbi:MAG TPA: tyrosine/phenylalanine carboxypeptidase domain-containing protein [Microthrixaceae bacterium]|nr:tyrosine/phenylalanine carboxypeptidase domain-containing protein [Microthrixaceae bacterium]